MRGLTDTEAHKVKEITVRLGNLSSPVLRLQAILQFSQIVDILAIGDTSTSRENELLREISEWGQRYFDLADDCGLVEDDSDDGLCPCDDVTCI